MSGSALPSEAEATRLPPCVRVDARLRLGVAFVDGQSRLSDRHEAGAFRFRFPRAHGRPPEAVLVNVAGGLAGGDRVGIDIHVGPGATLSLASAAAERIYRSDGAATELVNSVHVGAGSQLVWLPQETILYDGAAVRRHFSVALEATSKAVIGEMLYFGRAAAGEIVTQAALHDRWRFRRADRLILADDLRLDLGAPDDLRHPAALGGSAAVATLVLAMPEPQDLLDGLRARIPDAPGVEMGSTLVDGLVLLRAASNDAASMRRTMLGLARFVIERAGLPFPRAFTNE